jgi:two-component system copper resistance phosphate regulon response regulator CusR
MKICYVEDDRVAREFVSRGLARHGFEIELAANAAEAIARAESQAYELLILDVMLPDRDGFELLRELRERGVHTPVLFLTARGAPSERILGLELGADDYLVKPFAFGELVARIRVIARRGQRPPTSERLEIGDLALDESAHSATLAGRGLRLTAKEFALLAVLMRHRGEVLSRNMIVEQVWGPGFESYSNLVDVHVRNLRRKLGREAGARWIRTVTGVGYSFDAGDASGAGPL